MEQKEKNPGSLGQREQPLPQVNQPALGPEGTSDHAGHVDWELPLLFTFAGNRMDLSLLTLGSATAQAVISPSSLNTGLS